MEIRGTSGASGRNGPAPGSATRSESPPQRPGGRSKPSLRRRLAMWFLAYLLLEGAIFCSLGFLRFARGIVYTPVLSELTSEQKEVLTAFVHSGGQGLYFHQEPVLGWTPVGNNSAGMRDSREYDPIPPENVLRIAAYGDSFTYGEDVAQHDAWAAQLAAGTPDLEVLNYGVPGYGPDQAYLRYQQHRRSYAPHVVLIGYMAENLTRTVSVFRPFLFYSPSIYSKPRFRIENGELVLLPNPIATLDDHADFLAQDAETLTRLGEHDYHYQIACKRGVFDFVPSVRFTKLFYSVLRKKFLNPILRFDGMYSTESEAYELTTKILDDFYQDVLRDGALPIIVVFPDSLDQHRSRTKKAKRYQALLDDFDAKQYAFIDVLEALVPYEDRYTVGELTANHGHYNELGNEIVAEFLRRELAARGVFELERVAEAVHAEQQRLKITPTVAGQP